MKHVLRAAMLFALLWLRAAGAEAPDDQYLGIYFLIQEGDKFADKQQYAEALAKFTQAQIDLKDLKAQHPDWSPTVVNFRLDYLAEKITDITPRVPQPLPPPPPKPVTKEPPAVVTEKPVEPPASPVIQPPAPTPPQPPPDYEGTLNNLRGQLNQANMEISGLQAKLKEALSVQPASLDPQELRRAQEEVRQMRKEKELYLASLEEDRSRRAQKEASAAENEQLRQQLADIQKQVAELTRTNFALASERTRLEAAVKQPVTAAPDKATAALREENEMLKKRVAELSKKPAAPDSGLGEKLSAAEAKAAALQSDMELLRLENSALKERAKQASSTIMAGTAGDGNAARIHELETQRDNLQTRLDAALAQIAAGNTSKEASSRVDETSRQLAELRGRIEILEAKALPYTPEELALINKPETTSLSATARVTGRRSPTDLPAKGSAMLSEAKQFVANHEMDKAEAKYIEILALDGRNVATLSDLASIQVDLDHLDDAEKHIKAALALEPDNDYCLFVMGRLRFAQQKYDDALDALSRAAQLNPDNAEIQNYLGITLSEKGQREPAEAALRRAVQIDPNYASAHANLAFVYVTQQPPLTDLARWHYDKARAAGYPQNLAIEKLLGPPKSSSDASK